MSFKQFIFLNTLRNKKLYIAYFMSVVFSVMVYFTFSVFSAHPFIIEQIGRQVSTGMSVAQVIIYGFAFFFVLYSMGVFLQSRKREFGTLLIQGMSPRQLRSMVFFENFIIGMVATVVGIVVGLAFASLMLVASSWLLDFAIPWYFPTVAIIGTFIAFAVLFMIMSVAIQFRLPKLSVQELLKSAENGLGHLQTSTFKMILAVAFLVIGYGLALVAEGSLVFVVFIPVVVLVISGTYFFFHQFCVRIAQVLTKRVSLFWSNTNMIVFSDLAFRMKENARSFFLVTIISTVAFVSIGTLQGFQILTYRGLDAQAADITLVTEETADTDTASKVNHLLQQSGIASEQLQVTEKRVENGNQFVRLVSASDYNHALQLAGEPTISLNNHAVIQVKTSDSPGELLITSVTLDGKDYAVERISAARSPFYEGVLVVEDGLFQQITATVTSINELWFISKTVSLNQVAAAIAPMIEEAEQSDDFVGYISSKAYSQKQIAAIINPTLFVGLFIGVVFFVSAGSFLYFRLYSDFEMDIAKIRMVYKIGLTNRELSKILTQQLAILFFVPLTVSLLHGVVALNALFRMFNQTISPASLALLAVFAAVQITFFLIARMIYIRKVKQALIA